MPVGLLLPVPHRRAHHVVLTLWRHIDTIQHVRRGPLAQLVEQRPFKAWVTGSNPVWLNQRSLVKIFPDTSNTPKTMRKHGFRHVRVCIPLCLMIMGRRGYQPSVPSLPCSDKITLMNSLDPEISSCNACTIILGSFSPKASRMILCRSRSDSQSSGLVRCNE